MKYVSFATKIGLVVFLAACNGSGGGGGGGGSVSTSKPDPLAAYMWHLKDSTVPYVNGATPLAGSNINLGNVHSSYTGQGVKIVVSDGRIDLDHPDLSANADLSLSKDYRAGNISPYFGTPSSSDDSDSHGTGVAGLALGAKNNGTGGYGVAPGATLIGYNFLSSDQSASKKYDQLELEGYSGIFNYSYGSKTCQVWVGGDFTYAMLMRHELISTGAVYVTSAGNDYNGKLSACGGSSLINYYGNQNFNQEKSYPYFIVVAATNAQGTRASYSTPGANVWVSAPGGDDDLGLMLADIVGCDKGSTFALGTIPFDLIGSSTNPNCSYFSGGTGTSYASPIVTGAVAILRSVNPDLSWRDIKHILATTATEVDPTAGPTSHPLGLNLAGHTYQQGWVRNVANYGFHPWYGFGQVDLDAAKALAQNPDFDLYELKSTDTINDDFGYTSGTLNLSIPDNSSTGRSSTINVSAHNLFIEHVQIQVTITHSYPSDLGIELTSPSGTTTKLMNINSGLIGPNLTSVTFGANGFYGERSNGAWTLKVVDGALADTGTLVNWNISILGNKGAPLADTTPPLPPTSFTKSGSNLTWSASGSGDVARYEICIGPTANISTGCVDGDWRPVRTGTSLGLSNFIYRGLLAPITSGTNYTGKIRAVDSSENESSEVTTNWSQP
jgi:subtilisin-like proprotein convertase family protein